MTDSGTTENQWEPMGTIETQWERLRSHGNDWDPTVASLG